MRTFGLIGKTLSHSFSKHFFEQKFKKEKIIDAKYKNFELKRIDDFKFLKEKKINGFNVTIPYKGSIIPFLDGLSEEAEEIEAVNTIKYENEKWIGYNTDIYGFSQSLQTLLNSIIPSKALILGTGGASKAVRSVLERMKIRIQYVSQNKKEDAITYEELTKDIISHHTLIVNTTPLGMYPKIERFPDIPYYALTEDHRVFDLIYNPSETVFLQKAKRRGAKVKNGLQMLELQALKSWEIWNS